MHAALLALALVAAPPAADPEAPPPADVSAVRDLLAGWTDGKGHVLLVVPFPESAVRDHIYYGDETALYRLRYRGFGASGKESFDYSFWDPRASAPYKASVGMRDGKMTVRCEDRKTELTPMEAPALKALLDKAAFFGPRWRRHAYALARDDQGNYYYVDRMNEPKENMRFRLWRGPRGDLRLETMKNIISDSEGDMFATSDGELRLILDRKDARWVRKKKATELVHVPVDRNGRMIYTQLGVYDGMPLGTPCDDM